MAMADEKLETWQQLEERLAYYIMSDIARGTPAIRIASTIAQQTLMWRVEQDRAKKGDGNGQG
jgi:hypothetical protein